MDHQIAKDPRVILIGGTGRCGTNILKDIFARHSRVAVLPFEHRFFIDPDGILDFYSSHTSGWTPFIANRRIKRLEILLERVASDKPLARLIDTILRKVNRDRKKLSLHSYAGWELRKHFPRFEEHNRRLLEKLKNFSFGGVWPGSDSFTRHGIIHHVPPFSKKELADILHLYTADLLYDFLISREKDVFVEDNTWNIFFAGEWVDILPSAKLIHIRRDPRDVVASFVRQRWCPQDPIQAAVWLRDMNRQWNRVKEKLPRDFYAEIKLEDLVSDTAVELQRLCSFAGLDFEPAMLDIRLNSAHNGRWEKDFTEKEIREITSILKPVLEKYENSL